MTFVLLSSADIEKRITSIRSRSRKMDMDIHTTAVQCLAHAEKHGDVTLCGRLIGAMGHASRRQDLIAWFAYFGPVAINAKTFKPTQRKATHEQYRKYDVAGAEETPFWVLIQDKPPAPLAFSDIVGRTWAALKAAETAQGEGRFVGDYDEVTKLRAMLAETAGITDDDDMEVVKTRDKALKKAFVTAENGGAVEAEGH